MSAKITTATSPTWMEALMRTTHDVHQLPGWAVASAKADEGEPCAVVVTEGAATCLAPFLRRPITGELWDAVSPYGYSGPVWSPGLTSQARAKLLQRAAAAVGDAGAVSWFVRLHPMLETVDPVEGGVVVDHGPTVAVDLATPADLRWKSLRSGHRGDITRARREGCAVELDHDLSGIDEFARLYHETMERIGSSDYYRFGVEYFEALRTELGGRIVLACARLDGELVGGALFTVSDSSGLVGYHLSGSAPMSSNLQSAKLIIDRMQQWAADEGFGALHLGGGLGAAEDSLFRFKRGFSSWTHRFRTIRFVLDATRYAKLSTGLDPKSGFFPLYRAR
ncbi:MAG TPA: GNAT family N-acetyltransferase [Acidimicrobiales bacterium]|nr:GNAT family N-acetyltransferase [Acidimicrobiales bacterium]